MTLETRARQTRDLVVHELRAINTVPLIASVAGAVLIVGLTGRRAHVPAGALSAAFLVAGVSIALGAAFIFDDPATDSIRSTPTSLMFRRGVRITLTCLPIAVVWGVMLGFARLRVGPEMPLALPSLAFAAMLSFSLAAAAYGGRVVADGLGGLIGGPALLVTVGLSRTLPSRFQFFDSHSDAGYSAPLRLSVVIGICLVALLWASLDPGRVNRLRAFKRQR